MRMPCHPPRVALYSHVVRFHVGTCALSCCTCTAQSTRLQSEVGSAAPLRRTLQLPTVGIDTGRRVTGVLSPRSLRLQMFRQNPQQVRRLFMKFTRPITSTPINKSVGLCSESSSHVYFCVLQ